MFNGQKIIAKFCAKCTPRRGSFRQSEPGEIFGVCGEILRLKSSRLEQCPYRSKGRRACSRLFAPLYQTSEITQPLKSAARTGVDAEWTVEITRACRRRRFALA